MCLAQLFHLLLSEAFCDVGIFQVANHYFLLAPGSSKECLNVCVRMCVTNLPSLMVMVMVQPCSQIFFFLFFRGFTMPFLTILKAPFPFVNTCLSFSNPVCFARKGFFLYLYHTLRYCWACCIHQHTIRERGGGKRKKETRERVLESHNRPLFFPFYIKMCLHSTQLKQKFHL